MAVGLETSRSGTGQQRLIYPLITFICRYGYVDICTRGAYILTMYWTRSSFESMFCLWPHLCMGLYLIGVFPSRDSLDGILVLIVASPYMMSHTCSCSGTCSQVESTSRLSRTELSSARWLNPLKGSTYREKRVDFHRSASLNEQNKP